MPLSTEYPIDRLNYIIKDCNAKFIIIDSSTNLFLREDLINIDINNFEFNKYSKELNVDISPKNLLYIIYTSGSTGNPKGVKITHKNLNNFISSFNTLFQSISSSDHVLASTNICFDVSIFEFYIALLNSCSLYLYEENTINDIFKYCDSIINNNITMLYIPPNILEDVYKILKEKKYYNLNKILVGVEPIQSQTISSFYGLNPKLKIINGYGPTETTICASAVCLDEYIFNNYKIIPIGKPLHNTKLYVLDRNKKFSPTGVPGELYIAGDNVSSGYLNNKDLTDKAFVKIPEISKEALYKTGDIVYLDYNGNLNFIGRNDSQIKVNGHRIELGEIEKHIYSYPNISKVVVLLNEQKKLVAYYTSNINLNTNDIRAFLQTRLPQYLVPNFFVQIKSFKLTGNGKIDKKYLLSLKLDNITKYEEPHNEIEQKIVDIFKEILSIEKVGINDNLFDLGGDSLSAIKLQIEMFKCGFDFTYKDIYQYPTIKLLSEKLSKKDKVNTYTDDSSYDYTKIDAFLKNSNPSSNIIKQNLNNVLLTGATGFLGVHILDYLLTNTKSNIYCLVRSSKNQDAQIRLLDILHFYFGNKHDNQIFKRVFVLDGDITKKMLGINQDYSNAFGNTIDVVINSAAIVKHYGTEKLFLDTNVSGVQNIIDFCKKFGCKLVHISTTSVSGEGFDNNILENKKGFTEKNLYIGQDLSNIYVLSKFLSERLILENIINNSLEAKIIRVGNITSRYSDGHFQINVSENAFINKIHSFLQIKSVPDYLLKQLIEFTPVDLCAEAIVKLGCSKTNFNIFHLFNNNFITFEYLISIASKLGLNIKTVNENEFKNLVHELVKIENKKDYVSGIINDFDKTGKLNYNSSVEIKNEITNSVLENINFKWPIINENYIKKYIFYLKSIGYL